LNVASGIAVIMGVESVERSSSTKATKNIIDKGVAGRNMMAAGAVHRWKSRLGLQLRECFARSLAGRAEM
jgi:hypothetical protein